MVLDTIGPCDEALNDVIKRISSVTFSFFRREISSMAKQFLNAIKFHSWRHIIFLTRMNEYEGSQKNRDKIFKKKLMSLITPAKDTEEYFTTHVLPPVTDLPLTSELSRADSILFIGYIVPILHDVRSNIEQLSYKVWNGDELLRTINQLITKVVFDETDVMLVGKIRSEMHFRL